jgi:hypothetical protein
MTRQPNDEDRLRALGIYAVLGWLDWAHPLMARGSRRATKFGRRAIAPRRSALWLTVIVEVNGACDCYRITAHQRVNPEQAEYSAGVKSSFVSADPRAMGSQAIREAFCLYLWRSPDAPGTLYLVGSIHSAQAVCAELFDAGYIVKVVQTATNIEYEMRDGRLIACDPISTSPANRVRRPRSRQPYRARLA